MKKIIAIIGITLWIAGCATPPDRIAFNTLKTTEVAATDGLKAWATYCRSVEGTSNRVTLQQHIRVKAAYDAYRAAASNTVQIIVASNMGTTNVVDWNAIANSVKNALAGLSQAIAQAEKE